MTDQERIEIVKKILGDLNNTETGWQSKRDELRQKYKDNKEYEQAKTDLLFEITKPYGATEQSSRTDMDFMLTGEDVVKRYFQTTCGQAAKAFCYVHDKMVKSGEIKPLDLKIMMSTDINHLMDAQMGHTLPCVKMSDGKYHAFDPQIRLTQEEPDVQFLDGEIKVGNVIKHLLKQIKGKPYKIMAVMSWKEYEEKMSKFENFLKVSTERDKTSSQIISAITMVLKNMELQNRILPSIYNFCREIENTKLPIKIVKADRKDKQGAFYTITVKLSGDLYYFMPVHDYVFLHKLQDLGDNKFVDIGSKNKDEYTLVEEFTPKEYIKMFEARIAQQSKGYE